MVGDLAYLSFSQIKVTIYMFKHFTRKLVPISNNKATFYYNIH